MSSEPRDDISGETSSGSVKRAVDDFAYSLRAHLPRRLRQLRELGRDTRAIGKGKPRRG